MLRFSKTFLLPSELDPLQVRLGSKAPRRLRTQMVPVTPDKRKCSARSGVSALGHKQMSVLALRGPIACRQIRLSCSKPFRRS
jgi:hypothetical protein